MSTVPQTWERITTWLRANADEVLDSYLPPQSEDIVRGVGEHIGAAVPDDLRAFWTTAGGADPDEGAMGIFPPDWDEWEDMAFGPLGPAEATDAWDMLGELLDEGDFADLDGEPDAGVAPDFWNRGWLPFADNGAGDYLCVDLAPAAGGTVGQVITHSHETGRHQVLAPSLAAFLAALADRMEADELTYDEDYGVTLPDDDLDDE